jgi:hypothetical protein
MARPDEPIHPMTLGTMRRRGVRGLCVTCKHCGYETAVNVDAYPDHVPVPSFGLRMRCTRCGNMGLQRYRIGMSDPTPEREDDDTQH